MAEPTPIRTAAETALAEAFGAVKDSLPGSPAIRAFREAAFGVFDAKGLPHRRVEEWKYTDLRALMREARPLALCPDADALAWAKTAGSLFAGIDAVRIVIVDGNFVAALSDLDALPQVVKVRSLAEALGKGEIEGLGQAAPTENAALVLNAAFMTDGAVIDIAAGAVIDRPIHLAFIHSGSEGRAVYARSRIRVGAGASVTLVETYEGREGVANQTNAVVELAIGEGAIVRRVKAQTESLETLHISTLLADLGAGADLRSFTLSTGSAVARNQLFVRYGGEGAHATLAGATMLAGRRHSDTTLVVDHAEPGGESREMFKAVVDGEARSVFQGKIIVRQAAQKTDGQMMSASVLLSDGGEVNNKPELEIFADDVVCAHGATCGALDDDLMFYLKARGLPEEEAQTLLLQAFLGEAIETIEHDGLKDAVVAATNRWLARRV